MPSKEAEIQNIYALLNDFNHVFGENPKYSISFVSPERNAIYINEQKRSRKHNKNVALTHD